MIHLEYVLGITPNATIVSKAVEESAALLYTKVESGPWVRVGPRNRHERRRIAAEERREQRKKR